MSCVPEYVASPDTRTAGAIVGPGPMPGRRGTSGNKDQRMRAARIDPSGWHKRAPTWTKESVIRTIQAVHDAGGPLNHAASQHKGLTRVAVRLFGSWDAALRAAGLVPETIRLRRRPWQPEEVVQEIRRKAEAAEPLHACGVSPCTLYRNGVAFFGSWDAALSAVGLDPAQIRKRKLRAGNKRQRSRQASPGYRTPKVVPVRSATSCGGPSGSAGRPPGRRGLSWPGRPT